MVQKEIKYLQNTKKIRRVYTQEFCPLAGAENSIFYRPQVEVLRMLTAGEAWCCQQSEDWIIQVLVPIVANVSIAAAFRDFISDMSAQRACIIMPPVGFTNTKQNLLNDLLLKLIELAWRRAPHNNVWAVIEYKSTAFELLDVYFKCGFELVALRPMIGVTPCYVLCKSAPRAQLESQELKVQNIYEKYGEKLLIQTSETTRLALLLGRGWVAKGVEKTANEAFFTLYNAKYIKA